METTTMQSAERVGRELPHEFGPDHEFPLPFMGRPEFMGTQRDRS
jgi:hypothetical protein